MLPETMESVLSPMPMRMGFWPRCWRLVLSVRSSLIMAMAARRARSVSSPCGIGMPNSAMIASPMNLSSMPPSAVMQFTMIVKYSLSSATVPWAPSSSVRVVKERMSEKSTVASTLWPPRASPPPARRRSASPGSM